jgi:hypothetical protein
MAVQSKEAIYINQSVLELIGGYLCSSLSFCFGLGRPMLSIHRSLSSQCLIFKVSLLNFQWSLLLQSATQILEHVRNAGLSIRSNHKLLLSCKKTRLLCLRGLDIRRSENLGSLNWVNLYFYIKGCRFHSDGMLSRCENHSAHHMFCMRWWWLFWIQTAIVHWWHNHCMHSVHSEGHGSHWSPGGCDSLCLMSKQSFQFTF